MVFVYYTLAGLILYVLSDWILGQVEKMRGEQFEQRSLIFFVIILVLALTSFKAIEMITGSS
jgi:DMSO/TMAO reductase YedYZ heme-binding membrane subunit